MGGGNNSREPREYVSGRREYSKRIEEILEETFK